MKNEELIEHLKEYYSDKDTKGFNILDFVAFGSPLLAIAYYKLFFPDFVEYRGMIFMADEFYDEDRIDVDHLLEQENLSKKEIEQSYDWSEIPSGFFGKNAGDTYDDEDDYLAEILCQTWKCKLEADFPGKRFVVELVDAKETGGEIAVVFYQM